MRPKPGRESGRRDGGTNVFEVFGIGNYLLNLDPLNLSDENTEAFLTAAKM